jgi:alpha-L-fucosidase
MVSIRTENPVASIHYTLDGMEPGLNSPGYKEPFAWPGGGMIKARSFSDDGTSSEVTTRELGLSKKGWRVLDAAPSDGKPESAIDEDERTVWSTVQDIAVDMGKVQPIDAFTYLPRQDKQKDGIADRYAFYTSTDGVNWQKAVEGEFANIKSNPLEQVVRLDHPVSARYFKFSGLHVVSGNGVVIAEIGVRGN